MAFSPKLETDILDSNNIFTVSKLNNQVARILNNDLVLSDIYVAGEIIPLIKMEIHILP